MGRHSSGTFPAEGLREAAGAHASSPQRFRSISHWNGQFKAFNSSEFISPEGHGGGGHHQLDLEGLVLKLATKSALEKIHFVLNVNSHYWTQSPGAS